MNDIEKYKRLQNLFDFVKEEIKLVEDKLVDRALMKRVSDLELSIRSMNTLLNLELKYLKDLVVLSEGDLLRVPNFGRKSLNEVREVLAELNLKLNMNREDLLNKVQVDLGVNTDNYV
jgi:DNA-directed RNA polymerase alpha subunit|tara:strand:- start:173 stop:526 length:354 start_codon:yes stop_codon:yes gene_type:complete